RKKDLPSSKRIDLQIHQHCDKRAALWHGFRTALHCGTAFERRCTVARPSNGAAQWHGLRTALHSGTAVERRCTVARPSNGAVPWHGLQTTLRCGTAFKPPVDQHHKRRQRSRGGGERGGGDRSRFEGKTALEPGGQPME
ncbi:MAG: hypothetical protein BJ554DRAFT_4468, partial [Olpidium bornovanus]